MEPNQSKESPVETREINIVCSERAYRELEELADRRGMTSVADLVLSGIAWESFLDEVLMRGEYIFVGTKRGGKLKRVDNVRPGKRMREASRELRDMVETNNDYVPPLNLPLLGEVELEADSEEEQPRGETLS